MLLLDVNVLIYAMREDSEQHGAFRDWLQHRLVEAETIGISELALAGILRITTNHRIYERPSNATQVLDFCRTVLGAPAAVRVRPGERHWSIFGRLVAETGARGNDIPDAYFAALALENNATWVTRDRRFARFPGVRLFDPLKA